ncbi:hypothetical protein KR054_011920, partial [Drosophila jambulina]
LFIQILFLLLGWLAVSNSFGLDLGFLNPFRSSDASSEQPLPPAIPNMCNPTERRTLIRNAREAQRNDFVPLPTQAPTNNQGGDSSTRSFVPLPTQAPTNNQEDFSTRSFVPLPTLAPTIPTQTNKGPGGRQEYPSNDCDPLPVGIGTRLSAQLLKILTILG